MTIEERWSPNHRSRAGTEIDTVILHATGSTSIDGAVGWLCSRQSRASAHYVIGRDGKIVKLVPVKRAAFHAGRSVHPADGKTTGMNLRSVGIELVNKNSGLDPYPAPQREALMWLLRELRRAVPTLKYLYSHAQVALPKGRKTDPKGLDVEKIASKLGFQSDG